MLIIVIVILLKCEGIFWFSFLKNILSWSLFGSFVSMLKYVILIIFVFFLF